MPAAAAWTWGLARGDLSSRSERRIEGCIVGASAAAGHRLREGSFPPPSERRETGIAILGGGIAGLSAAWKLRRSGFDDFLLIELEDSAGGNSRYGESEVTRYPWGAHYVPIPGKEARAVWELFEEMGAVKSEPGGATTWKEEFLCFSPQERLFLHGRWHEGVFPRSGMGPEQQQEVAAFRAEMSRLRELRGADGHRAFSIPVESSSRIPEMLELDRISMKEYLDRRGWRSPALRWFVEYGCRDDYGGSLETTSAWAGLHYFCSREREDQEVLTWPEGNGKIVRHLADPIRERIQGQSLVFRVEPQRDSVEIDFLDLARNATVRVRAKKALFCMPRFLAPRVISGYRPSWIADFAYSPWMVANLHVDSTPPGAAWDNVIHGSESLGYVVATHQHLRAIPGKSVLTYYRPFCSGNPAADRAAMLARSWEQWRDEILADLRRAHPAIEETVRRIDVMLWGHAMIRPTPGFLWGKARQEAAAPFGHVHFGHSDMSGLSLFEEAQYWGVRAAESALGQLGIAFSSSL